MATDRQTTAMSAGVLARLLMALATSFGVTACSGNSSDSGAATTADERMAWVVWSNSFAGAVCAHEKACAMDASPGVACVEVGSRAAEMATCDAAVAFYVAHRDELEACINPYPTACSVISDEACPPTKDHPFESLCP